MLRVYECLTVAHDFRLLIAAGLVCALGSVVTMAIAARTPQAEVPWTWIALAGVCAGTTIWSTHFIAMLAYLVHLPVYYDAGQTLLSFVLGTALIWAGLYCALRRSGDPVRALGGGLIVGAGVVVLHYLGMHAVRIPGRITYQADLVALSILFSLGFGAMALFLGFGRGSRSRLAGGAAGLLLMTLSLHFTGMGAVSLELGTVGSENAGLSRASLAVVVTLAALSILVIGLIGAAFDHRLQRRLSSEARRFRTLANSTLEGIVIARAGRIIDCNAAVKQILTVEDVALNDSDFLDWVLPEQREAAAQAIAGDELSEPVEIELRTSTGAIRTVEIMSRSIEPEGDQEARIIAIRDVTARKHSDALVRHLALHDLLTDLANRRLFSELATKELAQAARSRSELTVLMLDLDHFKDVNDMHGHHAGDQVLRTVAERIRNCVRDGDIVARLGGDEFAILQSGTGRPSDAASLASRLVASLAQPIAVAEADVTIGTSIGVARYPDDSGSIDDLLRKADTAMYRAKADGKGMYRFFESAMDAAVEARRRLERRMRVAIAEDGFEVFFQPLVSSATLLPVGFEALARWEDPELGMVMPSEFIPVAEETGLIVPLSTLILRKACRAAAAWPEPLRVAVNLSPVQFRRAGLVEDVRQVLAETGLSGDRLDLEITESILIDHKDLVLKSLTELKTLGVRISMDDFGTGFSSLSYLQSFPFDKLKIDRIFVSDVDTNDNNVAIVRAVAAMGRSLNMHVVAEGVESHPQADLLHALNCDELQGYLIARPMPAEETTHYIARHFTRSPDQELCAAN